MRVVIPIFGPGGSLLIVGLNLPCFDVLRYNLKFGFN